LPTRDQRIGTLEAILHCFLPELIALLADPDGVVSESVPKDFSMSKMVSKAMTYWLNRW